MNKAAFLIIGLLMLNSCGIIFITKEDYCYKNDTGVRMGLSEAKEIAIKSECGNRLKDTLICNGNTGTWWIDLDIKKEGCSPACVINVETKQAEINWRCTGLLPS